MLDQLKPSRAYGKHQELSVPPTPTYTINRQLQARWRLEHIVYRPLAESSDNSGIVEFILQDTIGHPQANEDVFLAGESCIILATDSQGMARLQLYEHTNPNSGTGNCVASVVEEPADEVVGLGLAGGKPILIQLLYRKT